MEQIQEKFQRLLRELKNRENTAKTCQELNELLRNVNEQSDYLTKGASPLGVTATSTSALTITSILFLFNANSFATRVLATITAFILFFVVIIILLVLMRVLRAQFMLSRVIYHIHTKGYMEKTNYSDKEITDLSKLVKLASMSHATLVFIEEMYERFFWKFLSWFLTIVLILLTLALVAFNT